MTLLGKKYDPVSGQIFYVQMGGHHFVIRISNHAFLKGMIRWQDREIQSLESAAAYLLEAMTDIHMAVYLLRSAPVDGNVRKHFVWDKKRGIVYRMETIGYQIVVTTILEEKASRYFCTADENLLVAEESGCIRKTSNRETPKFCVKK